MAESNIQQELFPAYESRKIEFDFEDGDITSDAGSMLLRQIDRRIGLAQSNSGQSVLSPAPEEQRRQGSALS